MNKFKVVFKPKELVQFKWAKDEVYTVQSFIELSHPLDKPWVILNTSIHAGGAVWLEDRLELAPNMKNLKEELQQLVQNYEIESGLTDNLTKNAFDLLEAACRKSASRGKSSIVDLPVRFTGCKMSNKVHTAKVIDKLLLLLEKTGLTYNIKVPILIGDAYHINIYW